MLRRVRIRVVMSVAAVGALLAGTGISASASAAPASASSVTMTDVSCASTSHCWAEASTSSGSDILATVDGGARWTVQYRTTRYNFLSAIDCTSDAHCIASAERDASGGSITSVFLETTDGGKGWSTRSVPRSIPEVDAISCANGSDCWAIGQAKDLFDAAVVRSTDGGRVWTPQAVPKVGTSMSNSFGISCTSDSRCVAVGASVLTTSNGGMTWSTHPTPHGFDLGPVDCPTARVCYAVANVETAVPSNDQSIVYVSSDSGVTWKDVLNDPRHVAGLNVSCASTSTCVAVGFGYTPLGGGRFRLYGVSERTVNAGATWTETKVTAAQNLFADSCAVRTEDCIAVGSDGAAGRIFRSSDDGARWVREAIPAVAVQRSLPLVTADRRLHHVSNVEVVRG